MFSLHISNNIVTTVTTTFIKLSWIFLAFYSHKWGTISTRNAHNYSCIKQHYKTVLPPPAHTVLYNLKILSSTFWSFTTLYINKGQWIYMFHYTMLVHNQHMKQYKNTIVQCGLKQHAIVLPICKTTITRVVHT